VEAMPLDDKGTGATERSPGGHGSRNARVGLIKAAEPPQMCAEGLEEPFLVQGGKWYNDIGRSTVNRGVAV